MQILGVNGLTSEESISDKLTLQHCTTSVVLTLFEEQLSYNDFFLIVSTIYYTYYIYSLHPTTGHTEVEVCETVSPGPADQPSGG